MFSSKRRLGKMSEIATSKKGAVHLIFFLHKRNFKNLKWRQCKYLNNLVEQDYRNVKRRIAINTGFKDFESAQRTLAGIEIVNIIRNPSYWRRWRGMLLDLLFIITRKSTL